MEAVRLDFASLEYVSEHLANDRELVLEAVRQDGWTLQFAGEMLRNDNGGELL